MANKKANKNNGNERLISILGYFIVGIIWYFVDSKAQNPQTKFHIKQALNLWIISLIVGVILKVLAWGLLGGIAKLVLGVANLVFLVLFVIGIIYAIQDNRTSLPIIGRFAKKYLNF